MQTACKNLQWQSVLLELRRVVGCIASFRFNHHQRAFTHQAEQPSNTHDAMPLIDWRDCRASSGDWWLLCGMCISCLSLLACLWLERV